MFDTKHLILENDSIEYFNIPTNKISSVETFVLFRIFTLLGQGILM